MRCLLTKLHYIHLVVTLSNTQWQVVGEVGTDILRSPLFVLTYHEYREHVNLSTGWWANLFSSRLLVISICI